MKVVQLNINYFLWFSLLLILFAINPLQALRFGKYYIDQESRLWIEGSSTINDFSCTTFEIQGLAILDSVAGFTKLTTWEGSKEKYFIDASFKVKTRSLDCGNSTMNDDMYDALRADDFKEISFKLESAQLKNIDRINNESKVLVSGKLNVAGSSKEIELLVLISEINKNTKYRVTCNTEINMKDFDIEPPTAFFGLIKAHEELTLYLDLYIKS